jgi:hypothetical protein
MANRLSGIESFGVQFDVDRIGVHFVKIDLYLKAMLFFLSLHMHGAEP